MSDFQDDSADMRLLKWQRAQMGLAAESSKDWSSSVSTELSTGLIDHELPQLRGATVGLTVNAQPAKGLIPGALSTISLVVTNEGTESTGITRLRCPLPLSGAYRPGTLYVDGRERPESEADALFGEGMGLGPIGAHQRITLVFKLQVQPGVGSLRIAPALFAERAAVLGVPAIALERGTAAAGAFTRAVIAAEAPPEPPIYELDDEESLEYEAVDAALSPIVQAEETAVAFEPPATPAEVVVPAGPEPIAPPEAPARALSRPGERVLVCKIERGALALLERLFAGKGNLGLLPHYLLQNALVCTHDDAGNDRYGMADFAHRQSALLNRGLLQRKLGKPVRAADFPAELPEPLATFRSSLSLEGDELPERGLHTIIGPAEAAFFEQNAGSDAATVFVRARQVVTALQARKVVPARSGLEELLAEYASAAGARINRIFVKLKLNRDADVIGESDEDFDVLARRLIQALQALA